MVNVIVLPSNVFRVKVLGFYGYLYLFVDNVVIHNLCFRISSTALKYTHYNHAEGTGT